MSTVLQFITAAMGKIGAIGAGETPSGDDSAMVLERFNALIDSLGGEQMFAYTTTTTTATLTAGDSQLTIGVGSDINVARPVSILPQSFTRVSGIDYPLTPVSQAEFNAIPIKTLTSFAPSVCYYGGQASSGTVDFWPVTASSVTVYIVTPTRLSENTSLAAELTIPPGYKRYFEYAVAVEIWPHFFPEKNIPPMISAMAASAKRAIRTMNYTVPQLDMDKITSGRQGFGTIQTL